MTGAEFPHGALSRAELAQASRIATAVAVQTRGNHAAAWRHLATALAQLADARDPDHTPTTRQHQGAADENQES